MWASQGWVWCVQLLRALIGRGRAGGLRVGLLVALVVGAASLMLASVPPVSAASGDPVLAWGLNSSGQLGNGTNTNSNVPVSASLPAGTTVTAIAGGGSHSLGLTSTGQVLAWGANGSGQLGNGTNTNSNTPVSVSLPAGTTVIAVAAGAVHSLAVTSTGQVLAWGDNSTGQLGNGTNTNSNVPVSVSLPAGTTVTAVSGGADHSLARTSTGQGLAWGRNNSGQLGNGTNTNSNTPVSTSLSAGTTVTAISAGGDFSLAVTSTGQALAWGDNFFGELGNGTFTNSNVPVLVSLPAGTTVTAIAAGFGHGVALTSTRQVLAWGLNGDGQLGNGTNTTSGMPVSTLLPAGTVVTAIAAGGFHSLGLTSAGQVLAWGRNLEGQLGNGTNTNSNVPVSTSLPAGTVVTAIAAGFEHSLALATSVPPTTVTTTTTVPTTVTTTTTVPTTVTTTTTSTTTKTVTKTTTKTKCCHEENNENNNDNSNEDHEHADNNSEPWRLPMAR